MALTFVDTLLSSQTTHAVLGATGALGTTTPGYPSSASLASVCCVTLLGLERPLANRFAADLREYQAPASNLVVPDPPGRVGVRVALTPDKLRTLALHVKSPGQTGSS
jgi:hypothetical protein